jgi:hypothetical protein
MHHWITISSSTVGLVCDAEIEHIWRVIVPEHAWTCPFVMHSILALTGAHMAHLDSSRRVKHILVARHNHIRASELFRSSSISNSKQPNIVSTLAFLILTALTMLSLIQDEAEEINGFIRFLVLSRHSLRFAASCGIPAEHNSRVPSIMVASKSHPRGLLKLNEGLQSSLERLEFVNLACLTTSTSLKAILSQAIQRTKQWYTYVQLCPQDLVFIPHWIAMMPEEFLDCLSDKNHVALALLAHWIVPLHNGPKKWYMAHWPQRLVACIARELGATGSDTISWVMSAVHTKM